MKATKRARVKGSACPMGNDYAGYTIGPGRRVETVRYLDLTPEGFLKDYIATRRPVVIDGCLSQSEGWRGAKWTNEYLRQKAGNSDVKVEWRAGPGERFGKGREQGIKFGDFLGELEKGNELLYLTTQALGLDSSGRPKVMSAPLDKLRGDFPLRPDLVGSLVPQNVNLWMGTGQEEEGSSSGLHHDFHDNLYMLLRGKKKFRLFSPADSHRMYLEGEVVKVHPNGRINYKGKETRADGADRLAETAARAAALVDSMALKAEKLASELNGHTSDGKSDAGFSGQEKERGEGANLDGAYASSRSETCEKEVEAAQAALERGDKGAAERLALAEEELEDALEAVLDAECADGGGFGDGDCSGEESSDSDGGPGFFDGVNDNPTEEQFATAVARGAHKQGAVAGGAGDELTRRKRRHNDGQSDGDDDVDDDDSGSKSVGLLYPSGAGKTGSNGNIVRNRSGKNRSDERDEGGDKGPGKENSGKIIAEEVSKNGMEREGGQDGLKQNGGRSKATSPSAAAEATVASASASSIPSNFSKVDPNLSVSELKERFPMFLEAETCTVEVKTGQMLFLPAGWFHEVTSLASKDGHMAFNYWFHPPDATGKATTYPYTSSFWEDDWQSRLTEEEE